MKKELKTLKPYIRRLSVSYLNQSRGGKHLNSYHFNIPVPFIRLCGKWLEDAGFFPSNRISVTVEQQKLVIEMMEKD